jgi:putative N6-adenine-specific DNA methylase
MHLYKNSSRIFITCQKRLSPYLKQEVEGLGLTVTDTLQSGVWLNGSMQDCIKLNLNLRCASQVMFSLKQFDCNGPADLYDAAKEIRWEDVIPEDGYFSVNSNVFHPSITAEQFANVKIKDAIVDRLRDKTGKRPDTGPLANRTVVYLFWKDDRAELFIDTSGETLAKHGYRKIPGKAPMLEALAAATILATKWDRKSPFINPMCGSSTLAIEAAMLATKRTPGLYRNNFAFMHVKGFEEPMFTVEKELIVNQITEQEGLEIYASDISDDAINISKINAEIAGVSEYIRFTVCDFEDTIVPENQPGIVIFNPEYGDRLGDEIELEATYARMGDFLKKKCKGYFGYIFTGNLDLSKKIGLKPSRRIEFFTGKIDCRLLEYELYSGSKR